MMRLRQLAVLILLLVSYVAPVMACMRADAQMSAPERACCRMMKGQCGQMDMPASHNCCHKTLNTIQDTALHSRSMVLHPALAFVVQLLAVDWFPRDPLSGNWIQAPQHHPPESPPSSISVLRV